MDNNYDYLYKIVVIGDSGVGKSQLIERYARNTFNFESKSTIGVEFSTKEITIDRTKIKLQLWDTAGQERYRAITSAYYRGAVGVILCFDITKKVSFDNIFKENGWLKEAQTNNTDAEYVLIGTKIDLKHIQDVSYNTASEFAKSQHFDYFETSSLNNTGIDDMFFNLVGKILNKKRKQEELTHNVNIPTNNPIHLVETSIPIQNKESKCC